MDQSRFVELNTVPLSVQIAAIFHFDDAPIEKGCVRVVPGSHKLGGLPHIETGDGISRLINIRLRAPSPARRRLATCCFLAT